ncbi:MAG: nitrous oxide-stimulated promoter family protein [Spirochaetaceae bacterium]|nr:nitrous oxide-stimulated promoter family protein [Spirochaetaceae bacterium]
MKEKIMRKEEKTLEAMIRLFCRKSHKMRSSLCPECEELLIYAGNRLKTCPYKENKPTCSQCTTHCYKPDMRERVKKVMRYSGPRMLLHHPILAIHHLIKTIK